MPMATPGPFAWLGLRQGRSFSQLARSSTSRPSACVEALLIGLAAQTQRSVIPAHAWRILRKVQAIDSTLLRLRVTRSPWRQRQGFTPGVRVRTRFDTARQIWKRIGRGRSVASPGSGRSRHP